MKRTITESQLKSIILESVKRVLYEEYNKWFQTEENSNEKVHEMAESLLERFGNIDNTPVDQIWPMVIDLGYLNHSAFKVRPGMWEKYPDEMLSDEDLNMNNFIYSVKMECLGKLVKYYLYHGLDVKADEKGTLLLFREPLKGIRQITFHMGKDTSLGDTIEDHTGVFDGVRQAHHYHDDESYAAARNKLGL